jgi:hypothetical protein
MSTPLSLAIATPEHAAQSAALSIRSRSSVDPAVVYIESLGSAVSKAGMISPLNPCRIHP